MNADEQRLVMGIVEAICQNSSFSDMNQKKLLNLCENAGIKLENALDTPQAKHGLIFLQQHGNGDDTPCKTHDVPKQSLGDLSAELVIEKGSMMHDFLTNIGVSNRPFNLMNMMVQAIYPHVERDDVIVYQVQIGKAEKPV